MANKLNLPPAVESLAKDLQLEFPGRNGFSVRNLWNMREFYQDYSSKPKLQPLVAEISWTKAVLQHQIDNKSYEEHPSANWKPLWCGVAESGGDCRAFGFVGGEGIRGWLRFGG